MTAEIAHGKPYKLGDEHAIDEQQVCLGCGADLPAPDDADPEAEEIVRVHLPDGVVLCPACHFGTT